MSNQCRVSVRALFVPLSIVWAGSRLKRLSVAALLLVSATAAYAQPQQWLFDHNGSLMSWQQDGPNIWIVYVDPRPGVVAVGVRPGSPLFVGQWTQQGLVGLAHVYAAGCPAFPYPVNGGYASRGVIVLHGAAPVVDPYTCSVLWYTWDSANAHPSYSLVRARVALPGTGY
jgi:hypothetical protein